MNEIAKKNNAKPREEIIDEIRSLAKRADETSSQQMDLFLGQVLGDEDIDIGFDFSGLTDTANPDKSHKIFYGIRRLLIDYLPKGEENKKLRQKIYDEKNLFLNRGIEKGANGIRGSDGRMAYIEQFLVEAFKVVADWVSKGANAYDIWFAFWDLNEQRGYHK